MFLLTIKYGIFAAAAIAVNLLIQYISFMAYSGPHSLYLALFAGTIAGLIIKFILDKKFIFYYEAKSAPDNVYKFMLYSFMGIFTTLIFWGFEITFNAIFDFTGAKYAGGFIGLCIGYLIKYLLDKRFVFKKT